MEIDFGLVQIKRKCTSICVIYIVAWWVNLRCRRQQPGALLSWIIGVILNGISFYCLSIWFQFVSYSVYKNPLTIIKNKIIQKVILQTAHFRLNFVYSPYERPSTPALFSSGQRIKLNCQFILIQTALSFQSIIFPIIFSLFRNP